MAQQAGCPAPEAYLEEVWLQASGRGGRDGANVEIRRWGVYAKMRWSKEEMQWSAKRREAPQRPRYDEASPDVEPELSFAEIHARNIAAREAREEAERMEAMA